MSNGSFNFGTFIQESIDTVMKPKSYFASLSTEGGLGKPVLKALLYGLIAGLFKLLWSVLNLTAVTSTFGSGLFGGAVGVMTLIWTVIGAVIGLFIFAVIILIISAICGGSTKYEDNAHVAASLMVLMPLSALFGFVAGFSFFLSWLIGIIINIYGLFLMYNALVGTLKAKESSSKVLTWILVAIMVIFLVAGFFTKRVANKFMDSFGDETEQFFQDMGKEMEKAGKEMEKVFEEAADELGEAIDSLDLNE